MKKFALSLLAAAFCCGMVNAQDPAPAPQTPCVKKCCAKKVECPKPKCCPEKKCCPKKAACPAKPCCKKMTDCPSPCPKEKACCPGKD